MSTDFTIRRRRPWRSAFILLVLTGMLATGVYFFYERDLETLDEGLSRLEQTLNRLQKDNYSLRERAKALESEKGSLLEKIAILERGRQVDAKAYSKVDEHLKKLENDNLALREELAFYRGIVSSGDPGGISIQTFVVEREGNTDAYRYSLVLTRNMRNDKVVSGTVNLSISGEMSGNLKQLALKDVSSPVTDGLAFEFKHFQRLEGRMRLPRGFVPHRVDVKVHTPGNHPPSLKKTFDWSRATG